MNAFSPTSPNELPPTDQHADVIKVSANSRSTSVAGAIAGVIRQYHHAEVQAIGAGAVYQAVKAIAIARKYLSREVGIYSVPVFTDVMIDGQERTAIRFIIEERHLDDRLIDDEAGESAQ
jgi:stage V sporulation protein S